MRKIVSYGCITLVSDIDTIQSKDWKIIEGFHETVNDNIKKGFQPFGTPIIKGLENSKIMVWQPMVIYEDELINQPIEKLCLPNRTNNGLKLTNILLIKDLLEYTSLDLIGIPNMGKWSVNEVKKALGKLNLSLKDG